MTPSDHHNRPMNICLISYRSNPHCGGQGVYVKNLARAMAEMGHAVTILSGPPDLQAGHDMDVRRLPCLDLYDPADPFRVPTLGELAEPINLLEWINVSTMGFPEPHTFGLRAYRYLRQQFHQFDVVHDNQSLSYGIWMIGRRIPTLATIHHPITVDRDIAIGSVRAFWKKLKQLRWFSFVGMQKQVARRMARIITVSECSKTDISREFRIPGHRFTVIPNGISTHIFHPLPGIRREPNRLIVTNSADTPLKGLYYLLQAVHRVEAVRPVHLAVIGSPKENGGIVKLIRRLGIAHLVTFTGRISDRALVEQYARASAAVVPSVYEGFGLPAGEAMACGVPVISTTGGALPEVVGDAGVLVPPSDVDALAGAITDLLDHPNRAATLGRAGYQRVRKHFTWQRAAEKTIAAYRQVINDYRRF